MISHQVDLQQLSTFILGHWNNEQQWWKDDDEVAWVGDVRPITILCDRTATTGAKMHCAAFETHAEVREVLFEATLVVMRRPRLPFPGWRSVGHALTFLSREVSKMNVVSGPLREFLIKAGVMRAQREER